MAQDAPDGVLTYGRGLLQVDAAYKYLQRSADLDVPAGGPLTHCTRVYASACSPPCILPASLCHMGLLHQQKSSAAATDLPTHPRPPIPARPPAHPYLQTFGSR